MGRVMEAGSWTVVPPVCETGDVEIETSAHRLRPQATDHKTTDLRPQTKHETALGRPGPRRWESHRLSITFAVPPVANKSCPVFPSTTQSGQSLPPLGGAAKGMGPEDWFFLEEVQHLSATAADVKL